MYECQFRFLFRLYVPFYSLSHHSYFTGNNYGHETDVNVLGALNFYGLPVHRSASPLTGCFLHCVTY